MEKKSNQSKPGTFLQPFTVHLLTIEAEKGGREGEKEGEEDEQRFVWGRIKSLVVM